MTITLILLILIAHWPDVVVKHSVLKLYWKGMTPCANLYSSVAQGSAHGVVKRTVSDGVVRAARPKDISGHYWSFWSLTPGTTDRVNLAFRLPAAYKSQDGRSKYIYYSVTCGLLETRQCLTLSCWESSLTSEIRTYDTFQK